MKRKWVLLGSAIGISSVVMITTGMAAMAGTSGYDTYKSAVKNTKALKSVSVQADAVLKDNSSTLVNAKGTFKASLENHLGSGTLQVTGGGTEQSAAFYKQDSGMVWNISGSDVYYVQQDKGRGHHGYMKTDNQEIPQQVETVIDALVGNLKDYVVVDTKGDGLKAVSIQLEHAQIPTVVQALAPILIKQAADGHGAQHNGQVNFLANAPQLSQDIQIEKIAVTADINADNYLENQHADITVTGKDSNGAAHELTLQLNAELSDFNATTPDQVDLTGKNVQQINHGHRGYNGANE